VSFSTMSNNTVQYLSSISAGGVVCQYQYSPKDVIANPGDTTVETDNKEGLTDEASGFTGHTIHAICWRGHSRTLNVMCGKTGTSFLCIFIIRK